MNLKAATLNGFFWKLLERGSIQFFSFFVSIVLARLIAPEDFGVFSILCIFVNFCNLLTSQGVNVALVQKEEADDNDFNTGLTISMILSLICYIMIFLFSGSISRFFGKQELDLMLKIIALSLFPSAFSSMQMAYETRNFEFKSVFKINFLSSFVSGVCGIIMALTGFGVWTLIFQQILCSFLVMILLKYIISWRPKFKLDYSKLKSIYSFSWKVILSNISVNLYQSTYSTIVGKKYTTVDLAYYNRGMSIPSILDLSLNAGLTSVMHPTFSKVQNDKKSLLHIVRRTIRIIMFVVSPIYVGICIIAKPLVILIFGSNWAESIIYLQIFVIAYLFRLLISLNMQTLISYGKSELYLKLNVQKIIIGLVSLLLFMNINVQAIAFTVLLTDISIYPIIVYLMKKELDYKIKTQLLDVFPTFFMCGLMGIMCYLVTIFTSNNLIQFLLQIVVGGISYIVLSFLTKNENLIYITSFLKTQLSNKKRRRL